MSAGTKTKRPSKREKILETFVDMVAERGYHGTAINDVASSVGVSKGTILHHFGNKDGLLSEAGIAFIQRRDIEVAHAFRNLERPIDQLGACVYSTILAERDDRSAARAFGREYWLYKTDPRLQHARQCRERYVERVRRMIARCMAADVLRSDDDDLVLLQIYGMCNYTWTWYEPEGRFSAEEISARFARTLLIGLGTPSIQADPDQLNDELIVALLAEAAAMIEATDSLPELVESVTADSI